MTALLHHAPGHYLAGERVRQACRADDGPFAPVVRQLVARVWPAQSRRSRCLSHASPARAGSESDEPLHDLVAGPAGGEGVNACSAWQSGLRSTRGPRQRRVVGRARHEAGDDVTSLAEYSCGALEGALLRLNHRHPPKAQGKVPLPLGIAGVGTGQAVGDGEPGAIAQRGLVSVQPHSDENVSAVCISWSRCASSSIPRQRGSNCHARDCSSSDQRHNHCTGFA